ncbi:ATP-binding protein [Pontibacter vulgaris]|uniref:ATP-binding protein n=1 Tax=Pontibacter vulgaris TaxID=2905679 RepID=UPI001FA7B158|nr:ATP-binding protein [Pontibacter vulgaris]
MKEFSKEELDQFQDQYRLVYKQIFETEEDLDASYLEVACLLVYFDPEQIHPVYKKQITHKNHKGWRNFLKYCEPYVGSSEGNFWQVNLSVRRAALKRLGTREQMLKVLQASKIQPQVPGQKFVNEFLQTGKVSIEDFTRTELLSLLSILQWFDNILVEATAVKEQVEKTLPVAELLEPLRRLNSTTFIGRKEELVILADYVGVLPTKDFLRNVRRFASNLVYSLFERPPLLVYGPGGMGKSTLLARFILDHFEKTSTDKLPFVYLDLDRPILNLEQPSTLLLEGARQLASQYLELELEFNRLKDAIEVALLNMDNYEISKSIILSNYSDSHISSSARVFGELVRSVNAPVLFVVDTFEEAQFLGNEVVEELWSLFVTIQELAPNLRIIISGRALVRNFPVQKLLLKEFDRREARQFLEVCLSKSEKEIIINKKIVEEILDVVGYNPLSLRLAVKVFQEQGVEKLRSVGSRGWLISRVNDEVIQARLYGRILAHIHDPEVKKLAFPGLVVRRITPSVIINVLAKPCNLKLNSYYEAELLMQSLSKEVSLVEVDPLDSSLRHRQDVRRIMINDLKNEISSDVLKSIHDLAVEYYADLHDEFSRAEEIYHRLSRGDEFSKVDNLWQPTLKPLLQYAIEELPDRARIWLSSKLGVTPDTNLLKRSDLEYWEEITAKTAQRHLQTGNAIGALDVLRERQERSPTSPLYHLELEALRMMGLFREAETLVNRALLSVNKSGNKLLVRELLLQSALIQEAQGKLDLALTFIKEAEHTITEHTEPIEVLRVLVCHIRLLRKLGNEHDKERANIIENAKALLLQEHVVQLLSNYPNLLRELAAELGKIIPSILHKSVDLIGIDVRSKDQIDILSAALAEWNNQLQAESHSDQGELAVRAGIKGSSLSEWSNFISKNVGKNLNNSIKHWMSEIPVNTLNNDLSNKFNSSLVDIYRSSVNYSLESRIKKHSK